MIALNMFLDEILGGGLQDDTLTLVYGPPASGKTNIALLASVEASRTGKVVFIDPEGGFSTERLRQITGDKAEQVLANIVHMKPTTFNEQQRAVDEVESMIDGVSLIIVDSIAMLYRLEEDRDVRMLGRMLAKLLRYARKYGVPVLATNQVYVDIDSQKNVPVGGIILEYWCKVIIELDVLDDGTRIARVNRHKHVASDKVIRFRIVEKGLEKI